MSALIRDTSAPNSASRRKFLKGSAAAAGTVVFGFHIPVSREAAAQAVPIAAEAGDFVLWHHALPHSSSPNRGSYPRIVQYLNMYPVEFTENMAWL